MIAAPEFLRDLGVPARSPLESGWTPVNGLRLHSRRSLRGDGVPFLLIHGLVISSLYMIPLAEHLAARHSAYALDLPGFGRSEGPPAALSIPELADAAIAWMAAVGLERCHLMGNSMGCEVVAHIAARAPEYVASATLVGPTLDPAALAITTQTLRLLWDALHESPALWANWFFDFLRAGPRRAVATTQLMFRDHIEHQLPQIVAPTAIVRGEFDPTVPQAAAEQMARLVRGSELRVIPGTWHCVHYAQPARVAEIMEEMKERADTPPISTA